MAARYPGELFVRVVGDERAAKAHMPAARLVMGKALEMAATNNLGSYVLRQQLQDGSVVVAEKIGDLKRVTITTPEGASKPGIEPGGGFILWPRWNIVQFNPEYRGTEVDPDGNYTQAWLEFVGTSKITRYYQRWDVVDDIKGARYEPYGIPQLYPDGIPYYGNCDWKNGGDYALSFYGYYSRYNRDVNVADERSRWIFQQGQVLFDRLDYADSIDDPPDYLQWRINSACLRESAQGGMEMVVTFTDYFTGRPTTCQSAFVSFRVLRNEGDEQKGNWSIELDSHELLGMTPGSINPEPPSSADDFVQSSSPWFFNSSGTEAIRTVTSEPGTILLPNTVTQIVKVNADDIDYSSEWQPYLIGDYDNSITSFRLRQPTRSIIASDYVGDERRDCYINFRISEGDYFLDDYSGKFKVVVALEFDGGEIILMDRDYIDGNDKLDYHQLCFMDLRHNLFAGWRVTGLNGVHWIQSWAFMGGRMEYGVQELIDWDPMSGDPQPFAGLDTRPPGQSDGLVYGNWYTGASSPGWGPRNRTTSGVIWRRHPRQALTDFGVATLVIPNMAARSGVYDNANFNWIGGWNFNKGRYCVSMAGAYGTPLNYITGGNMGELLGITAEDQRFWPLTVLPKAI